MKFSLKNSLKSLHTNFQFIYGIFLFVLIPAALVVNTVVQINSTNTVMDVELQRKAALAAGVFSQEVGSQLDDQAGLQRVVTQVADENEEIRSLDVLVPSGESFVIFASLDTELIGEQSEFVNNTLAWQIEETIAYQTTSAALSTEDPGQLGEERFWVVVKPVVDEDGAKAAIVTMKVSSKVIDDLTQQNLNRSLIVLAASVLIIVLLLVNNARLYRNTLLLNKLKELDQMKDEFISMASHELRAPITGIRGYLRMILDKSFGELPPEAEAKLGMVLEESDRLHDLVEDLLEVSRIEQGRIKLLLARVNLGELLDSVMNTFDQQAKEKGLSLIKSVQPSLPAVRADGSRLTQVLVNLVSNSIKYTMHGKVEIVAEEIKDKKPMVKIKISDTGMGMSSKDREKLFEKFYRVRNKQTDKITGTGLGLWITRELVHLMDGEIYVDSIEHVGTHVTVLLPIFKEEKK